MRYAKSQGALWTFVAVALAMRLLGPVGSGLWYDEIWTLVDFGRMPLGQLLTTYGSDNNHPLNSVLVWASLQALGESAFALRLPALLFGVAAIGVMLRMAIRVTRGREALLATVLLLLSYHEVWFSQNARGYTMLLCLTMATTLYFIRSMDEDGYGNSLRGGVCLGLSTYAHVSGVFVALAQLVATAAWIARARRTEGTVPARWRQPLAGVVVGGATSLAVHGPILSEMLGYFLPQGEGHSSEPSEWTSPFWAVKAAAQSLGLGLSLGLVVLLVALVVLGLGVASYGRRRPEVALCFLLPGLLGGAIMLGLGRNLWPRFFFFQAGFFLLIIVRGMALIADYLSGFSPVQLRARADRWLFAAAGIAAIAVFVAILPRAYTVPKQDFEGALAYLQRARGPQTPVVTVGLTQMPYSRYFHTDFKPANSVAELRAVMGDSDDALIVHTLPTFLQSRHPQLFDYIADHAVEVARFAGSVGDGDVVVLRLGTKPNMHSVEGDLK